MDFGGDLKVLEPSIIFQMINIANLTGRLKLITAHNVATLYFETGQLTYAKIDTGNKRVGEILIEKELISEDQLEQALQESRRDDVDKRVGDVLIENEDIDQNVLVSVIQEQIKRVVYMVLEWVEGQFIFLADAKTENEDILIDVKLDHLLLEGLKRLDEARKI
ncbi:MAG: DUF4388 domain-containing protein [Candidatus Krumholzibacteriota bacterium]|nr:DUF4388 domain-containing protein [Candidatus Krumholzibacteriota bacterium]